MAFHQRQAAGLRKQIDQHHRLVIDLETVIIRHFPEKSVPDVGPRGLKRKVIIDLTRHAGSRRLFLISPRHPNRPAEATQDRHLERSAI
jgi:hypothetical protein